MGRVGDDNQPDDAYRRITLADFAAHAGISVEEAFKAFYWLVRHDPTLDRFAILNAGCSAADLAAAEARVQHRLHPLHRLLLTLSNGGTIPFVSLSLMAAAVVREREWRIIGPFLTPEELAKRPALTIRQLRPIPPMVLGASLRAEYGDVVADMYHLDDLIPFAAGYGGEEWSYVRGDPDQIKVFLSYGATDGSCDPGASDFAEFISELTLDPPCTTAEFVNWTRAAIQDMARA